MLELVLLGPVEVRADATSVPLAPLERNLLALLALAEGAVLSTDRIIDGLWSERPPAAPRSRVQGLVSSLRRKIGTALVTRNPGYQLLRAPADSDLSRCEDLAARAARAGSPDETAELLRAALALWRGTPLDGVTAPGADADRMRLIELRVSLQEQCFEAELVLGRHAPLIRELMAAVAADPLRERLTGQLMTALYRSNRQAEALRTYAALRHRLAEELGGDPCADLRELHAAILRGERRTGRVPAPRRPAQLPAAVGHFAGRAAELAALTGALPATTPAATGQNGPVVLVTGAGGLGKTALTVHWAHTVADRFPDGQIFVDLRATPPGPALTPGAALAAVLLALGVPATDLPDGPEERAAMFRTRVHGRRLLIVADDAASVPQLLPLVPPTPGSLVVATSRLRLTALRAHHAARVVDLPPLDPAAARDLLAATAGRDRLRGPGVAEMVELCGGWPLALRLAGATLAARGGQPAESFVEELRDRVERLSVGDDPRTVHRALAQAHAGLDPAAVRLFDQLGLLPAGSVPLHLAAATAGISTLRTRRLLDDLIAANLVLTTGPDRYGCHDLIRRYAARRGAVLADRAVIEERAVHWYLTTFETLAARVRPGRARTGATGPAEWVPFRDGAEAARFAAAEAANLPAVLRWVDRRHDPRLTWHLASAVAAVCPAVTADTGAIGVAAAAALDDPRALGEAHAQLGLALLADPVRADAAHEHLRRAAGLLEADRGLPAVLAAYGLGVLLGRQGEPAQAGTMLDRALDLLDPSHRPLACAVALFTSADLLMRSGAADRGHERFAQAVILTEATAGRRFDRGGRRLGPELGDEFRAHLGESLHAPRVTEPDRALAGLLLTASGTTAPAMQLAAG